MWRWCAERKCSDFFFFFFSFTPLKPCQDEKKKLKPCQAYKKKKKKKKKKRKKKSLALSFEKIRAGFFKKELGTCDYQQQRYADGRGRGDVGAPNENVQTFFFFFFFFSLCFFFQLCDAAV
jgi:hypothetical protein